MAASLTAPKLLNVGPAFTGSNAGVVKTLRVLVGAASADVIVDAQATYQIASIPAGVVVNSVKARVITAFSTSVTIGIGDTGGASSWLATAKIAPQTADTAGVYKNPLSATAEAYAGGKKYLTADTIQAVIAGATPAAGLLEVLIEYIDGTAGTS